MAPAAAYVNSNIHKNYLSSYNKSNHVAVPDKIKCNTCLQVKGKSGFSSAAQGTLKRHMQDVGSGFNPIKHTHIVCSACGPQQMVELLCYMCDLTKGLDKFTKVQRRNRDHAMCMRCMQEKQNYEPGGDDGDYNSGSGGSEDYDDDDSAGETYSLAAPSSLGSGDAGTYADTRSTATGGGVRLGSSDAPPSSVASKAGATVSSSASKWAKPKAIKRQVTYAAVQKEIEAEQANDLDEDKQYNFSDSD